MARIKKFEDIESWKLARTLTKRIYEVTNAGQFAYDFGLKDQTRRASVSILSNIAEGLNAAAIKSSYNSLLSPRILRRSAGSTLCCTGPELHFAGAV